MQINEFVEKVTELYDDLEGVVLKPNSKFKEADGWSSLVALSLISMIDEDYDVNLGGDDIRCSETIEDLFNLVKSRI